MNLLKWKLTSNEVIRLGSHFSKTGVIKKERYQECAGREKRPCWGIARKWPSVRLERRPQERFKLPTP